MQLVIFSYREEYTHTCGRSCNCVHGRNSSDFQPQLVASEEEAAAYLAKRLMEDEDASYVNLVFAGWPHVVHFADSCAHASLAAKGLDSIRVHSASPSYEDDEDTAAVATEERRVEELHGRIVDLTRTKLGALQKAKADEKAARERAEHERKQDEIARRERGEFERLKTKFEPKP